MSPAEDQHAIEEPPRRVLARRSQMAGMREAWTAVRRIVVPVAWKTASKAVEALAFASTVGPAEDLGFGYVRRRDQRSERRSM